MGRLNTIRPTPPRFPTTFGYTYMYLQSLLRTSGLLIRTDTVFTATSGVDRRCVDNRRHASVSGELSHLPAGYERAGVLPRHTTLTEKEKASSTRSAPIGDLRRWYAFLSVHSNVRRLT